MNHDARRVTYEQLHHVGKEKANSSAPFGLRKFLGKCGKRKRGKEEKEELIQSKKNTKKSRSKKKR